MLSPRRLVAAVASKVHYLPDSCSLFQFTFGKSQNKEATMNNKIREKSHFITAVRRLLPAVALILTAAMLAPAPALTAQYSPLEGIIQGVNCVHNKTACPEGPSDAHIAAEHDFVLLLPDGDH